jgi:ankyrin repeat protein
MSVTSMVFLERVLEGDVPAVCEMLAADPALARLKTDEAFEHTVPPGSTPLHLAVRQGHAEVIDALIAAGAPLDERNRDGRTPLHDALQFDNRMRARLIDAGATIDICHAAFLDLVEEVRDLLLSDPALANDRTTGLSPLGWASYGGAARAARLLIELGANGDGGELLCAAQVGGVQVGRLLLDRGADPNCLHRGFNALHAALTTPYTDDLASFVALVIEHGADVNASTASGRRPLDLLAQARTLPGSTARAASLDACEALLLEHGAQASV